MKKCTVIFTRSRDGEIKMFRQMGRVINQEGVDWDSSTYNFRTRLHRSLQTLSVDEQLVLNIEVQPHPTRQVNGDKKGS